MNEQSAATSFDMAEPLRCAITASAMPGAALLAQARALAEEGVPFLQLRDATLTAASLAHLSRALLKALAGTRTRLLINARADVALATGAPGVHLRSGPGEMTPMQIHTLYCAAGLPPPLLTIAAHTIADVARICVLAAEAPVTAILFGPVFEKRGPTTPDGSPGPLIQAGTGLPLLAEACRVAAPTPVLALGGLTAANIPHALAAGAAGYAAIRFFQR